MRLGERTSQMKDTTKGRVHHRSGSATSKICKLIQHVRTQAKGYAGEDIAMCPKDFPFLAENDIVEICNPDSRDEVGTRLLLKITKGSLRDDFPHKDAISIEQSLALQFQLKNVPDVLISKVNVSTVELDSLELTFKDQYLGRSEMWRLKTSMENTCLYLNKRIEFAGSTIRCQVCELWSHGKQVSCGVVRAGTKIVFRSSSSMVYLFIQMSSEMWDFDIYGDLYFEKAVNGFLTELFTKWKKNGSNHEVTIVLFSRLYYLANTLEQFPESVRLCLQIDYKGRFYEDYYRVAVQSEKYDDWSSILTHLKHLFVEYQSSILSAHGGQRLPRAFISSAAQGNVLEVLNMSLNVFDKHYMDRSFDRTGQLSVVITPGVGVFEVDRELTTVTMQRIIDNGVGSDLVCVGEQPLHAVPLLKFHNKTSGQSNVEDYSMPHWINQSFYSSNKKVGYSSYIPRIKLPTRSLRKTSLTHLTSWDSLSSSDESSYAIPRPKQDKVDNSWPNSVYDFDDYDAKVFQAPNAQSAQRRNFQRKKTSTISEICLPKVLRRQNSEPEIYQGGSELTSPSSNSLSSSGDKSSLTVPIATSPAIAIPNKRFPSVEHMYSSSFGALNVEVKPKIALTKRGKWYYDDLWTHGLNKSSSGSSSQSGSPNEKKTTYSRHSADSRLPSRALINPFDPSHAVIKLTSNRRRWTHIFPRGPSGALIQQHHFHSSYPKLEIVHESSDPADSPGSPADDQQSRSSASKQGSSEGSSGKHRLALLWGATGEMAWSCALQTGVDWKSLTIPACLPITTDYFPDERSLQMDYVVSDYNLVPEDVNADYAQQKAIYRSPLTTREVLQELISQRLAQGFQLIIPSNSQKKKVSNSSLNRSANTLAVEKEVEEYFLSIGRVFHKITLDGATINVTRYRPRHAYRSIKIHYRYLFHAPNNRGYEVSWAEFHTEKLENYNWNYLDHYICTRGDRDFVLVDSLKYWRFRMFLLPSFQAATKKIQDGSEAVNVYAPLSKEDKSNLVDGFLKFVELSINRRIRRPNTSGRKTGRFFGPAKPPIPLFSRERLGSNTMERPRARPISKGADIKPDLGSKVHSVESSNFEKEGKIPIEVGAEYCPQANDADGHGHKLRSDATSSEIMDLLRSPSTGFSFVKCDDLPKWTFVSSDATQWLIMNIEGISESQAVDKFNKMLQERLICHASGNTSYPFVPGFYFYFIIPHGQDDGSGPGVRPIDDLGMFQDEWMEVRVEHDRSQPTVFDSKPKFCRPDISEYAKVGDPVNYRQVYVDVDVGKKSDRQEWGHLKYQSVYRPDEAFELVIQWVQATGSIITELVQSWSRKAQQCNMQLIPIPNDPFALSSSSKADSLRGPIFIPLNIECLMGNRSYLFEDFQEDTWDARLFLLQDSIVQQFGFISTANADAENRYRINDHHYIHATGNMFIFIQSQKALIQGIQIKESPGKFPRLNESPAANSQDDYITRHVTGKSRDLFQEEMRVGFLWSCNYMVSKRWKTSSTPALGDDSFVLKVLKDFTAFCGNQNNRLITFWETYMTKPDKRI